MATEPDENPSDPGSVLFSQALELWVQPEITRRQELGQLPAGFVLRAAQVIMTHDHPRVTVRLNDEVKVVLQVEATRAIDRGEPITEDDFSEVHGMTLTDADPDAGHLTIVRLHGGYVLGFDFRYNAGRIREHLRVARQFLDVARHALQEGHSEAVIDNLFSGVELLAKGALLMHLPEVTTSRTHGFIQSAYNKWSSLGNVDTEYSQLLNRLAHLRNPARYLRGHLATKSDDLLAMANTAERMYSGLVAELPVHTEIPADLPSPS